MGKTSRLLTLAATGLTYHVKSRGWCDLGYNFLVDRFGRAFEGRYGGAQLPVLGAHTGSYNANSFGVASGTHSTLGVFRTRYRRLGAGSARLGLPVTDLYAVQGGLKQKFQRGWLIYNQHEGKVYIQYGRAS
jgi:uncharacterized protein with LGFP repeats